MMTITCEPFDFASEDTNNDRISFEWTNAPEGAAKQFRREWFQVISFHLSLTVRVTAWCAARTCPWSTTPESRPPVIPA